jgi:protein-S-isoprenylcysteine O-methyltransferase Ste14
MANSEVWHLLIELPWIVFLLYWIIGALRTRATRDQESFASRFVILLFEIIGYGMIFSRATGIGLLRNHVIPRTVVEAMAGVLLTWSGIGLAVWARYHLAENWSARVTIKEGHQLIRTRTGDGRFGAGDRPMAMCSGSIAGAGRL